MISKISFPHRSKIKILSILALNLVLFTAVGCRKNNTNTSKSSAIVPDGIPGNWTLKFDDEFNGNSLDSANWWPNWFGLSKVAFSQPINVSDSAAYDPAEVTVSGGHLNIALEKKPVTVNGKTYPYRTGLVYTNGYPPLHQFTFGAFEARIYLPAAPDGSVANWPAWWADGQNWPADGEMDIMEGLSGSVCYHFHSPSTVDGGCAIGSFTGWHTYSSRWANGVVDYYYDGIKVGSIISGVTNAPMYLILSYGSASGTQTTIPATMQVDYVRVWQR